MSTLLIVIDRGRSLIKTIKCKGPSIDPCGTPVSISNFSDTFPWKPVHWFLSSRYDLNHLILSSEHLFILSLCNNIWWSIRSKAFRRSNNHRSTWVMSCDPTGAQIFTTLVVFHHNHLLLGVSALWFVLHIIICNMIKNKMITVIFLFRIPHILREVSNALIMSVKETFI